MDLLLGLSTKNIFKLLKQNHFEVEAKYFPRLLVMLISSSINSYQNIFERKYLKRNINEINGSNIEDPVFIIGHWRSGTTFLHNLIINDEQFASPNIFEISNPTNFLYREDKYLKKFENFGERKRPMDNIKITQTSPGEDEFAISAHSLISPLFSWVFPQNANKYKQYLTLENSSAEEIKEWEASFIYFLKKLNFRYRKKLLLKSPTHTGKISNIIKLFPNAKFIHIYRDHEAVFKSTFNLYKKMIGLTCLHGSNEQEIEKIIIDYYKELYNKYLSDRKLIKEGNIVDVTYSDLVKDNLQTIKHIYNHLNLNFSDNFENNLINYINSQKNYKPNILPQIDTKLKNRLDLEWGNIKEKIEGLYKYYSVT